MSHLLFSGLACEALTALRNVATPVRRARGAGNRRWFHSLLFSTTRFPVQEGRLGEADGHATK
jgi:hypothetical protein